MRWLKGPRPLFVASLAILFFGALAPIVYLLIKATLSVINTSFLSSIVSDGQRQLSLLSNTVVISLGVAFGSILVGAPLAFLLSRVSFPGRLFFLLICPVSLLIPPYVHTICWIYLVGESSVLSHLLPNINAFRPLLYGPWGAILIMIVSYYPIVTLLSYAGFNQMDTYLEDAARIQAGAVRATWGVTWSLARPAILSGGLFTFIFALSNFAVPSMLRVQVYSLQVFYQFSTLHQMDQAALYAVPLLFLSMVALMGIHRLERDPRFIISSAARRPSLFKFGTARWIVSGLVLFLYGIVVFMPAAILLKMAGPWENYVASLANAHRDIVNSFWSAVTAASGTVAIGGILAIMVWGSSTRAGGWLERLCILSFAFPAAAAGIGIIGIWNRGIPFQWVYSSLLIVVVASFCRYISFAFKPVQVVMRYISPALDESARVAGIPWWRRFMMLLTPLSSKGFMVAWFLVYLFSLTDLDTAILVNPPGKGTLPIRIFNMLHFGRQEWVAALCVILIGMALIPYMILVLWGQKEGYASISVSQRQ